MKRISTLFIGLFCILGFEISSNAQSLVVNGSLFIPQDSIEFTFESPSFDTTDWIGIYHVGEVPGGPNSTVWDYIPDTSGTIYLQAPDEAGDYIAFLCCCDGYDIIATSAEFQVALPVLAASLSVYTEGDSLVFNYVSPKFSDSDWIGLYPTGTKPGDDNPSIDWDYITDTTGTLVFYTDLDPGIYDAYLLCCNGYDSISACTFEIKAGNVAYVEPKSAVFKAGSPIEITFNDPSFTVEDWIGLYFEGDDPQMVSSVTYAYVNSQSGTVSFPGTLSGGNYFAVLFCCGGNETIYAQSEVFTVEAGASGTYIKTVASVYPEGVNILVNYRNPDLQEKDWIGIYNKGETPGDVTSIDYQYITADSGTIEFTTELIAGEYVVFMLCCDVYNIKAKYNFKVADASTPSLVASSMTYAANDSLVFYYNSPSFDPADWIGIYHPGDVPGDVGSIAWQYITQASGTLVFHYPYPPYDAELEPGEYWAGLLCCDIWDLYAQTTFFITEPTAVNKIISKDEIGIYPNPSNGLVSVRTINGEGLQSITVFSLTGQVVYNERISGMVSEKNLNLGFLSKGMYIVNVQVAESSMTVKMIIQ